MGYLKVLGKQVCRAVSDVIPLKRIRQAKVTPTFGELATSSKTDTFVRTAENAIPKKLQTILDGLGTDEKEFLAELYSTGSKKFDYLYNHKYFAGEIPHFNDKEFIKAIKDMPEKELKQTFDEISNLYETLPKEHNYDPITEEIIESIPQMPNSTNLAQLTILKKHNKEAYEYILNNPDKKSISRLLSEFQNKINGSAFETLTIPQIKQLQGVGRTNSLNYKNPEDLKIIQKSFSAMPSYVESSDLFNKHPEQIQDLHNYLSKITITEPFNAYRAEKDTGMFSSIALDKNLTRKVKLLALKNMFKTRKVKVHDFTGEYGNRDYTNLFSQIMGRSKVTLADAMQMAKYGDDKFRLQIAELIKKSRVQDNRFKSLTFDRGFAKEWVETQDGHTKILQNMDIDKGIHGTCSSVDNRQAEFILDNENKVMSFKDVKYDPQKDVFYIDSRISQA